MSSTQTITTSATSYPTSYDSGYSAYSVSNLDNALASANNTTYAQINLTRNQGAITNIYYNFTFNIPTGATINSVTCSCKCLINTTNSSRITTRTVQLYAGATAKGTAYNVTNSTTAFSITAGNSWTAAEVNSMRIRLYAVRGSSNTTSSYYFRFYGATVTVNYSYNETIYEVTVTNSASGITVSPETADIVEGDNCQIAIFGDITGVTVKDNNIDVTSQLVRTEAFDPSYSVATRSGMTYGFVLTNGWYESNNQSHANSAALSRVTFNLPVECEVTFTYINYAEATYDFGIFSKLDTALTTNYPVSSSSAGDSTIDNGLYEKRLNASADNTSTQKTLIYTIPAGEHFVDVKFGKDAASDENNDSLKFTVAIDPQEVVPQEDFYVYNITNIQADHTIIITSQATGNSIWVKVNGSWVKAQEVYVKVSGTWKAVSKVSKKVNGSWVEQSDKSAMFDQNAVFIKGN